MIFKDSNDFEEAIRSFSEEIKYLARQTRTLIHKIFPEVVEVIRKNRKILDLERL